MTEPMLNDYQIHLLAISLIVCVMGSFIGVSRHLSGRDDAPERVRRKVYGALYALIAGGLVFAMLGPAHLHQTGEMLIFAAFLSTLLGIGAGYLGSRNVDQDLERLAMAHKLAAISRNNDELRERLDEYKR